MGDGLLSKQLYIDCCREQDSLRGERGRVALGMEGRREKGYWSYEAPVLGLKGMLVSLLASALLVSN